MLQDILSEIQYGLQEHFEHVDHHGILFLVHGKYNGGAYADVWHRLYRKYGVRFCLWIRCYNQDEYRFYGPKRFCLLIKRYWDGSINSEFNELYSISPERIRPKRDTVSADDLIDLFCPFRSPVMACKTMCTID